MIDDLDLAGHGLELRRPGRAHDRAARGRARAHVLRRRRRARPTACAPSRPADAEAYPALRRAHARAGRVRGRGAVLHPAPARQGRAGRRGGRPAARPRVPPPRPPGGPRAHPRAADGGRRPRRRVVQPTTRCAARSPPAARSSRRWGRGRPGPPSSCSPTRPATTAAPPARPRSSAAGPRRSPSRSSARPGRPAPRCAPSAEVTRAADPRRPHRGRRARGRRADHRDGRGLRRRPEDGADRLARPGRRPGRACAGGPGNIRTPGATARLDLTLSGLPAFAGVDGEEALHGRLVFAPGIDAVEQAFDAWKYGRVSERPYLEATIPTLHDPGAPGEGHRMTVLAQWVPYAAEPDEVAERVRRRARAPRAGHRRPDRRDRRAHAGRRSSANTASRAATSTMPSPRSTSSTPGGR